MSQNTNKEMCCGVKPLLCSVDQSGYGVTLIQTCHISGSIRRGRTLGMGVIAKVLAAVPTANCLLLSWWHQQIERQAMDT